MEPIVSIFKVNTMEMEAAGSSKTVVPNYQTTWHNNSEKYNATR
jgi:hypothetical protein